MKTYVLTVSRTFPKTHKRAGEETFFKERILSALSKDLLMWNKIHTIRANYVLWANRIKEIQEGKAILSIRYWSGKPYNSKHVEICQLDKNSGCGLQELNFLDSRFDFPYVYCMHNPLTRVFKGLQRDLAKNDGLSLDDFKDWFRKYDLSKPMAIIHFTTFRY